VDARATSRYFAGDGAPNADILAFCRAGKATPEVRDLAPGVQLTRDAADFCSLEIRESPVRDEVLAVLHGWSKFDAGTQLDRRNELSVSFEITPEHVRVHWTPYVELEKIIGTGGQLIVGFDVKRVLGKPCTGLRDAVTSPFTVEQVCDADGCAAEGLRPPHGDRVRIGCLRRAGWSVKISTVRELVPRIQELITASLGSGEQDDMDSRHIVKDGVRYVVRAYSSNIVQVIIEKI
jgi:hypothetical protein